MPPPNPQDRSNPSSPPIPLVDLGYPSDTGDLGDGRRQHTRGRSLLGAVSRPTSGGYGNGPKYEMIGNNSPSPPMGRPPQRPSQAAPLPIPESHYDEPGTPISPVDPGAFQSAMGFAGLLVPDISVSQPPPTSQTHSPFGPYGSQDYDGISPYGGDSVDDLAYQGTSYYEGQTEADSIPLTDTSHLQPIAGSEAYSSGGQRHDRSGSWHDVNFNSSDNSRRRSSRARLGDNLSSAEQGHSPSGGRSRAHSYGNALTPEGHHRSRSPSTTSGAFLRAGSIVRAMSQRVVNISGEAEFIEASARRATTRISRQPSLSTMASLSDEEEIRFQPKHKKDPLAAGRPNPPKTLPTAPVEKAMKFFGKGEPEPSYDEETEKPPNPLRGKSLGIFSQDSKVRTWLCDVLVYPLTEPVILILIMVQTVLLAVESSKNVFTHPRAPEWGSTATDYAILALFIIFTFELVARIIVSGLIINAPEYSATRRKGGMKAIVMDRYRTIFKPERNSSQRRSNPLLSAQTVVRSFTAIQGDKVKTVEQAQRLQLARRAFLRHGFNRLDFVAVLAFWVAFVLGVTKVESDRHFYVFRMLSCLRILRLLALTHGTAVSVFAVV
jgi:hypothetical protein